MDDDKATWITHYRAHNERVVKMIPSRQLLVLDVSEPGAMKKLCDFVRSFTGPCVSPGAFPRENIDEVHIDNANSYNAQRQHIQSAPHHTQYAYVTHIPQSTDISVVIRTLSASVNSLKATKTM